ncbi:SEC14-like protein 2 isoform X2 [Ornithodoros turicata]
MIRKNTTWRKQHNVDNILTHYQPKPFIKKNLVGGWCGFNKNGGPTWIYPLTGFSVTDLLRGSSSAEVMKEMTYRLEVSVKLMEEQSIKLGRNVETHMFIFDFGGFPMSQALHPQAISLMTGYISVYEANYPERMQEAVFINVMPFFTVLFNLFKRVLTSRTLQKITIFGKDNWKEFLLERIDKEQLPVKWGGTKTDEDGDPRCPSLITVLTPISEEEFAEARALREKDSTWVTIDRRALHEVPIEVPKSGHTLWWEFETEHHDIAFSVVRRPGTEAQDEEVVHPCERVEAHFQAQGGCIVCDKPGTYVLKFDNTFSSYRSKKLGYVVRVEPPAPAQTITTPH